MPIDGSREPGLSLGRWGMLSEDERYCWDGARWRPAPTLRQDYVWNGRAWQVARTRSSPSADGLEVGRLTARQAAAAAAALLVCGGAAAVIDLTLGGPLRALGLEKLLQGVALVPVLLIHVVYDSAQRWFGLSGAEEAEGMPAAPRPAAGGRPWWLQALFYTALLLVAQSAVALVLPGSGSGRQRRWSDAVLLAWGALFLTFPFAIGCRVGWQRRVRGRLIAGSAAAASWLVAGAVGQGDVLLGAVVAIPAVLAALLGHAAGRRLRDAWSDPDRRPALSLPRRPAAAAATSLVLCCAAGVLLLLLLGGPLTRAGLAPLAAGGVFAAPMLLVHVLHDRSRRWFGVPSAGQRPLWSSVTFAAGVILLADSATLQIGSLGASYGLFLGVNLAAGLWIGWRGLAHGGLLAVTAAAAASSVGLVVEFWGHFRADEIPLVVGLALFWATPTVLAAAGGYWAVRGLRRLRSRRARRARGTAVEAGPKASAGSAALRRAAAAATALLVCGGASALLVLALGDSARRSGWEPVLAGVAAVPVLLIHAVYEAAERWFGHPAAQRSRTHGSLLIRVFTSPRPPWWPALLCYAAVLLLAQTAFLALVPSTNIVLDLFLPALAVGCWIGWRLLARGGLMAAAAAAAAGLVQAAGAAAVIGSGDILWQVPIVFGTPAALAALAGSGAGRAARRGWRRSREARPAAPSPGRLSKDERYYWDGGRWQPAPAVHAGVDYVWNGSAWQEARVRTRPRAAQPRPAREARPKPRPTVRLPRAAAAAAAATSMVVCGGVAAFLVALLSEPLGSAGQAALLEGVAVVPVLFVHVVYDAAQRWFGFLDADRPAAEAEPAAGRRPWWLSALLYAAAVVLVEAVVTAATFNLVSSSDPGVAVWYGLLLVMLAGVAVQIGWRRLVRGRLVATIAATALAVATALVAVSAGNAQELVGVLLTWTGLWMAAAQVGQRLGTLARHRWDARAGQRPVPTHLGWRRAGAAATALAGCAALAAMLVLAIGGLAASSPLMEAAVAAPALGIGPLHDRAQRWLQVTAEARPWWLAVVFYAALVAVVESVANRVLPATIPGYLAMHGLVLAATGAVGWRIGRRRLDPLVAITTAAVIALVTAVVAWVYAGSMDMSTAEAYTGWVAVLAWLTVLACVGGWAVGHWSAQRRAPSEPVERTGGVP
jgi:hypothetical protein